jgi:hypothetical protein
MSKIVISSLMRAKNKQSFFALHQIQSKIKNLYPDIEINFHVIWDSVGNELNLIDDDYWSKIIDSEIKNLYSYDKTFFNNYVKIAYGLDYEDKFSKYVAIYHILIGHYLRRVKLEDYYLVYDDDILIHDDFKIPCDIVLSKKPMVITEPANNNCDKVLFQKFLQIYGEQFREIYLQKNPNFHGFNSGFQGLDLAIYDDFLSADRFKILMDIFEFKSIYDENGEEIWDERRFFIDTQQQSFFGLANTVLSKKELYILDPEKYFVVPNYGLHPKYGQLDPNDEPDGGWRWGLESKITHFIGHTRGKGKPKQFLDRVDEYLKQNNFL